MPFSAQTPDPRPPAAGAPRSSWPGLIVVAAPALRPIARLSGVGVAAGRPDAAPALAETEEAA